MAKADQLSSFYTRHATSKMYICQYYLDGGDEVCAHQTKSKFNMKVHLQSHFKIRPHRCTTCNKWFTTKQNLVDHQRRHSNNRQYVCPVDGCFSVFFRKRDLLSHGRTRLHKDMDYGDFSLLVDKYTKALKCITNQTTPKPGSNKDQEAPTGKMERQKELDFIIEPETIQSIRSISPRSVEACYSLNRERPQSPSSLFPGRHDSLEFISHKI